MNTNTGYSCFQIVDEFTISPLIRKSRKASVSSPDKTYVADHSIELLRAALIHVYNETKLSEKTVKEKFSEIVNAPRIPVETVMTGLIDTLRGGSIFLDSYFRQSSGRSELIAKFLGILELLKSKIISVEDISDEETGVTDIASHVKITLIADDETIQSAALDSWA